MSSISRDQIENNLDFVGFVVAKNNLKDQSKDLINTIKNDSRVNLKVITGDNILTSNAVCNELRLWSLDKSVLILDVGEENLTVKFLDSLREETIKFDYLLIMFNQGYRFAIEGINLEISRFRLEIIKYCSLFARVSPKEKGLMITRVFLCVKYNIHIKIS